MGEGWHQKGRGLYIFLWTGEWGSSVRERIFRIQKTISEISFRLYY
jgi:hypothetical protein